MEAEEIAGGPVKDQREELLQEISRLAFSDIRDYYREDGTIIPLNELSPDLAAAVVTVETSEVLTRTADGQETMVKRVTRLELADKVMNLELLGRYLGLFPDQVDARPLEVRREEE